MRIIQSFKDLNILASSGVIESKIISTLSTVFWDNYEKKNASEKVDVLSNFTKILIFEKGDNLKNTEFVALGSKGSGILGTSPSFLKHFEKEKIFLYKIGENQESLDILIEEEILDKDILEFFNTQLFLLRNNGDKEIA